MTRRPTRIYGAAFALSLLTLAPSYLPFVWMLIHFQTWRLGHPNPFVFGPEIHALECSLVAAVIVFCLVVRRQSVRRRTVSSTVLTGESPMSLKEQINLFEHDSKILEEIAGKYPEDSNEYRVLKHAAIALWFALAGDPERFKEYVVKFAGDLTPEQRAHLLAMGIDPDFDPD